MSTRPPDSNAPRQSSAGPTDSGTIEHVDASPAGTLPEPPGGLSAAFPTDGPPEIPGYSDFAKIGQGGMGVVYRASHATLNRHVAIKVHQPTAAATSAGRFSQEARITGRLQHPGIPPVYELGTAADGRVYMAMKLIDGETLAKRIVLAGRDGGAIGLLVEQFEQVCRAVAYAHSRGIVHRDLKPANVMIGAYGAVYVMDWGLAKLVGDAEPTNPGGTAPADQADSQLDSETQPGAVIGTPAYMPPEQARGEIDNIDRRADVFALGATLCEILTGQPPYRGAPEPLQAAMRGDTTEAFARLDASGTETERVALIALAKRCLAADPADRPTDAEMVADTLAELRAAAATRARGAERERDAAEVRSTEQEKRLALERNKARITRILSAVALLILVVGVIVSTAFALQSDHRAGQERLARKDADTKTQLAQENENKANVNLARALAAEKRSEQAAEAERLDAYVTTVGLAWSEYERGRFALARSLLDRLRPQPDRPDRRGFEWHYLNRLIAGQGQLRWSHSDQSVEAVQYTPDGTLYTASRDGTIKAWDADTGKLKSSVVLNLGTVGLAIGPKDTDGSFGITSVVPLSPLAELPNPPAAGDVLLAVGPSVEKLTPVRELTQEDVLSRVRGEPGTMLALEIRRKGETEPRRYALTRRVVPASTNFPANIYSAVFSPDCRSLAVESADGFVVWDVAAGRRKYAITDRGFVRGMTRGLVFSPDSKLLTEGGQRATRRVWEAATGKLVVELKSSWNGPVQAAAFLPDGRSLVGPVVNGYGVWKLDAADPQKPVTLIKEGAVTGDLACASPDGRWLAVAHSDLEIYLHDLRRGELRSIVRLSSGNVRCLAFSADSRLLAGGGADHTVRVWDASNATELTVLRGIDGQVNGLSFRPDGRTLTAVGRGGEVVSWDLSVRPEYTSLRLRDRGHSGAVAFTRDNGSVLFASAFPPGRSALGNREPALDEWNRNPTVPKAAWQEDVRTLNWLASSADRRTVAITEGDDSRAGRSRITVWGAAGWEKRTTIEQSTFPNTFAAALSPDGRYLAASVSTHPQIPASTADFADVWKAHQVHVYERGAGGWERVSVLTGFREAVMLLEFADGDKKLLAGELGGYSVWDWRNRRAEYRSTDLGGMFHCFAPSPDGRTLALSVGASLLTEPDRPSRVELRELATGKVLRTLDGHAKATTGLAFSPDGTRLATACLDGAVRVWNARAKADPLVLRHTNALMFNVTFSPDGRTVFATWAGALSPFAEPSPGGLTKWDATTGRELRSFSAPGLLMPALALADGGKTVVAGELRGRAIRQWDAETLAEGPPLPRGSNTAADGHAGEILAAVVSPDDRLVATGGADRTIKLWDRATRRVIATLDGHADGVFDVAFADDGRTLIGVAWGPHERTVKAEVTRWDVASRKRLGSFHLPPVHAQFARVTRRLPHAFLKFGPDGRTIATLGEDKQSIEWWDVTGARRVERFADLLEGSTVIDLAVSPDGRQLAAAVIDGRPDAQNRPQTQFRVVVWDVANPAQRKSILIASYAGTHPDGEGVFALAFSPGGTTVAVGRGSSGVVEFWDVATGRKTLGLQHPHRRSVSTLVFAPDGRALVAGTSGPLVIFNAGPPE